MVGVGTPSAVQDNVTSVPDSSTRTWLLALVVKEGGSVEKGNLKILTLKILKIIYLFKCQRYFKSVKNS